MGRAGITAAPELPPKVARRTVSRSVAVPGCICAVAPGVGDGRELQGARGRLGSRSQDFGGLMQESWMQEAHGPAVRSERSPGAGGLCLVRLPLESVLVHSH